MSDECRDTSTGTRGEYTDWVIETRINEYPVRVWRSPYPEGVPDRLNRLRKRNPHLTFTAVRRTVQRKEEEW